MKLTVSKETETQNLVWYKLKHDYPFPYLHLSKKFLGEKFNEYPEELSVTIGIDEDDGLEGAMSLHKYMESSKSIWYRQEVDNPPIGYFMLYKEALRGEFEKYPVKILILVNGGKNERKKN